MTRVRYAKTSDSLLKSSQVLCDRNIYYGTISLDKNYVEWHVYTVADVNYRSGSTTNVNSAKKIIKSILSELGARFGDDIRGRKI